MTAAPANRALKGGLPRQNHRQPRRRAPLDTRQRTPPAARQNQNPRPRRRSPKSLPTLANTLVVKTLFPCAKTKKHRIALFNNASAHAVYYLRFSEIAKTGFKSLRSLHFHFLECYLIQCYKRFCLFSQIFDFIRTRTFFDFLSRKMTKCWSGCWNENQYNRLIFKVLAAPCRLKEKKYPLNLTTSFHRPPPSPESELIFGTVVV